MFNMDDGVVGIAIGVAIMCLMFGGGWVFSQILRIRAESKQTRVDNEGERAAREDVVMQQAIAYQASHGNELSIDDVVAAQIRLHDMTDVELSEAEEEIASLDSSI